MRPAFAAGLACLLVLPAAAQPVESVTVTANALLGIWKVTCPHALGKSGFFGDWKWDTARDGFCRVGQGQGELTFHCLSMGAGTASLSGTHVHLAWGSMMARFVIDGEFQSQSNFAGHAAAKLAGISIEDPGPSSGVKIDPQTRAADEGGKADLLRAILSGGLSQVPHDLRMKDALPDRASLGRAQAVSHLGQQAKYGLPGKEPTDFLTVYAIEFDNGERICGLNQRDGGSFDAFQCA
mgnify:CR=1 FL=1